MSPTDFELKTINWKPLRSNEFDDNVDQARPLFTIMQRFRENIRNRMTSSTATEIVESSTASLVSTSATSVDFSTEPSISALSSAGEKAGENGDLTEEIKSASNKVVKEIFINREISKLINSKLDGLNNAENYIQTSSLDNLSMAVGSITNQVTEINKQQTEVKDTVKVLYSKLNNLINSTYQCKSLDTKITNIISNLESISEQMHENNIRQKEHTDHLANIYAKLEVLEEGKNLKSKKKANVAKAPSSTIINLEVTNSDLRDRVQN